ncbi:MAG: UDP-N-acetylmuramoyl-L-alanyl-D-glutamate--2,6-diaminopimelate ligase [Rikenellaceae bacterium]
MKLERLIEGCKTLSYNSLDIDVRSLTFDSRAVEQGSCFFAIVGSVSDGHNYIEQAIDRGAKVVVCERMVGETHEGVSYVVVEDANKAMGEMACRFYGDPSRELKLVGVTGTNGKTTTATMLADLFEELGYATGLISTVTYRIDGEEFNSTHTTPDAIRLNSMLREMVDRGCEYCFMEVSSHAVVQNRIGGLEFAGGLFSNLTHDHLDYHGTFAEYIKAKKLFFDGLPKSAFALVNVDDRNGEVMVQNCRAQVARYSLRSVADFRAKVIEMHLDGMLMQLCGEEIWVQILGRFNAYNILAVYSTAILLGAKKTDVLVALSRLKAVNGRFEHFAAEGGRTIIIDYAHTPDALKNVLTTINEIRQGGQNLTTVCGCGGDRDSTKRAEMARIAYENSTMAIFTSDNPRHENPEEILRQMIEGVQGMKRWIKITDRAEAIRTAVMMSKEGEIILIAGKGHETYQIIGDERVHFDDREVAGEAIAQYLGQ